MEESDDTHAALALMYGYAAKYAPPTVIEARIDALVVCTSFLQIYNMCVHGSDVIKLFNALSH